MTLSPRAFISLLFLLMPFGLSACGERISAPSSSVDGVKEQAQHAFANYVTDLNRGNYENASQIYDLSPDFHWIERGGIQYSSGAEAAASLRLFEEQDGRARMTTDQMIVTYLSPTSALISTHFDFAMIGTDGNIQFAFDGWMSVAMVKRQDHWFFAAGQVGPGARAQ